MDHVAGMKRAGELELTVRQNLEVRSIVGALNATEPAHVDLDVVSHERHLHQQIGDRAGFLL
jgi:hypothetical protein